MKKLFSNPYLVISLYLLFSFVIDIMTNLTINLSFSIGMILRGILLIYVTLGLLFKYKDKNNYFLIGLLGIFSLIYLLYFRSLSALTYIVKYDFALLILLFIYNLYKTEDKKINDNVITFSLLFYSVSIIISYLFKLDAIFNSYNEMSAIIAIIIPYLIINLEKRFNVLEFLTVFIALFAGLIIGTRLPLLAFLISILYLLIKKLIKDIKNKKINYTNIILFILFVIAFMYKFKATPIYKNMVDHINNLNLNNPVDVFTDFKLFDHFIFNRRLAFLIDVNKLMVNAPIINKLIGLKYISKSVQMDLFDVLYRYGVIGFTLFAIFFSIIIKKLKNTKINYIPVMIIMITSFLSGHVILSPNVVLITIIIIANLIYKRENKSILLASYDLGVGGIESALLTLTKNINKDNNRITLYLEHKKGELLKEVPENIKIKRFKVFNLKFKVLQKALNTLSKIIYLITNYKEYDFSCCYATYSMPCNFIARYASNNNSIYIHSDYTMLYKNNIKDINKFFKVRKLDKFNHIIFVSNEAKNNLISIYPEYMNKSLVINNFIDNEKIIKLSEEKIKENKPRGKKLFLFVGRIDESSKNFTRLINSFALALKQNKNLVLWIVGSGPDENKVKKLIQDKKLEKNVLMLGKKTNPYPYFKLTDYVILTSNYEGFPVIYGEAITLGKPIITTINVTDEAISIPNNFGYICQKNEEDVSNTILAAVSHNTLKYKKVDINKINQNKYDLLNKIM